MLPDVKRIAARSSDFEVVLTSSKSVSWHSTSYFWTFSINSTLNPCAENLDPNLALVIRGSGVIGLDRYWMDGIRMDFGWIGSAWSALLDGLDGLQHIQLDPADQKGKL